MPPPVGYRPPCFSPCLLYVWFIYLEEVTSTLKQTCYMCFSILPLNVKHCETDGRRICLHAFLCKLSTLVLSPLDLCMTALLKWYLCRVLIKSALIWTALPTVHKIIMMDNLLHVYEDPIHTLCIGSTTTNLPQNKGLHIHVCPFLTLTTLLTSPKTHRPPVTSGEHAMLCYTSKGNCC